MRSSGAGTRPRSTVRVELRQHAGVPARPAVTEGDTVTRARLIELGSIAAGYQVCDAMLKAADVELVLARSICSGKYMVMVRGEVGAVRAAVASGNTAGSFSVIDCFTIANLHESIFPAISGTAKVEKLDALGILESSSVASLIEGADAAAKAADVRLIEGRLAMALGGKAFVTLTGDVAAVESAVAAAQAIGQKGLLVNKVVILPVRSPPPRRVPVFEPVFRHDCLSPKTGVVNGQKQSGPESEL